MTNSSHQTGISVAICAALATSVLALYAQTARFDFVALDDHFVFADRPEVNRGLTWAGARWAFTTIQPDWQPVTMMSHMLTYSLGGADPGVHHLVNAAQHAVNAVLLFLALRVLCGAVWPSALVAALFALHPLRVESVAWVSERKDTMSGMFWMITLLAYGWYARRPTLLRYGAVFLAFGLGLMSKPILVTLPLVLLLLDVWPLGRWGGLVRERRGETRSFGGLVLEKLPLLVPVAAVAVLTLKTSMGAHGLKSFDEFSIAWRLAMPPLAYAVYLLQSIWPAGLAAMYPHPALIGTPLTGILWQVAAATAFLIGVSALCWLARRTRPYLLVGWLWFLITLLPVIGFAQVGAQWHADRFTYLPTIGVAIMLAWSLRDLVRARPRLRAPVSAAAGLAIVILAFVSWKQIGVWANSIQLFEHAIEVTSDNYFAHQVLAAQLRAKGDLDSAQHHLEAALRIRPNEAYAHEQLGLLFERRGDRERAAESYETALRLRPDSSWRSRRRLAQLRLAQNRLDEAVHLLEAPEGKDAATAQLRLDLGTALIQKHQLDAAISQLERAVSLAPDSAAAHNNLGVALAQEGRYADAVVQFERTLALQPDHRMAARSLQWTRQQMGAQ